MIDHKLLPQIFNEYINDIDIKVLLKTIHVVSKKYVLI